MSRICLVLSILIELSMGAHEAPAGFSSSTVNGATPSTCFLSSTGRWTDVLGQRQHETKSAISVRDLHLRPNPLRRGRRRANIAGSASSCEEGAFPTVETAVEAPASSSDAEVHSKAQAVLLQPTVYRDSWFDKALQKYLTIKIKQVLAEADGETAASTSSTRTHSDSPTAIYDEFIDTAVQLSRRPGWQTQLLTLGLLRKAFPSWFPGAFRAFLSLFPMWFDARHAAVSSVLLTGWLVGPSEVCDVDPAVLDPALRQGWGNEPSGWVPGFALGGRWRKELGAGQGVQIERCRVLELSGCASVCANVCKAPTQHFFTHDVGLPLTMVPDYETQACTFIFGAAPPPHDQDPAFQQPCLSQCIALGANAGEHERGTRAARAGKGASGLGATREKAA
eukprot:CAMPEP_0177700010 /NCGR_PEP_ID=MMETSP0484_2-20121128/5878_1 /TAXON_ID=354590 /ORGANISM="Rhodomonas lens, Strain RHODO" /LENGTH=393 /DNA_ID=CAMNT_0019211205 /DNA_START=132 /DNA_END=1309 /DNA_ORIENTATION=-